MNVLTQFQIDTEVALLNALRLRSGGLRERRLGGQAETFIRALISGSQLELYIYDDEASILGPGIDERFEAPDYPTSSDLARAFISKVLELVPSDAAVV